MLNANNQYFYEGGKNRGGAGQGLMDDANEDDFWYQAPKMAGDMVGGAAGEYQGFVNNQPLASGGGSRKKF